MSNLYRGTSKDASYQVLIHLAKRFQRRRFFRNQPIRNKNCLWRPCLLINGSELNQRSLQRNFQGCFLPSFDSFGLAVLEETIFKKSIDQKQELPVATMFVNGSELNEQLYRGPAIDTSYQVLVHLAQRFQRRRFKKIGQSETRIAYGGHVC